MQVLRSRAGLLNWSNRASAMCFFFSFCCSFLKIQLFAFSVLLNQGFGMEKPSWRWRERQQLRRATRKHSFQTSSEADGTKIWYLPCHLGYICAHGVRAWRLAPFCRSVCRIGEGSTAAEKRRCSSQPELIWIKGSKLLAKQMDKLMGDKENGCQVTCIF